MGTRAGSCDAACRESSDVRRCVTLQNPRRTPCTLPRMRKSARPGSTTMGFIVGCSGLQHDALAVAREALHGGLVVHERSDDVTGLRRVLAPDEDEVAVHDVGVDHAVAAHAQREEVLALALEPVGLQRDGVSRRSGPRGVGVPAAMRPSTGTRGWRPPRSGRSDEDEGARDALVGDPALKHALALERAEVVEGGARGEAEALADLPDRGRRPVALGEAPDEAPAPRAAVPSSPASVPSCVDPVTPRFRDRPFAQQDSSKHPLSGPSQKKFRRPPRARRTGRPGSLPPGPRSRA